MKNLPLISRDIKNLVDMYCYLFELNEIGLSLRVLDKAMCPRFHVDHVPCRLITTYTGVTTQWLPHTSVDRSKFEKVIMVKKMKNLVCLVKVHRYQATLCWRCRSS